MFIAQLMERPLHAEFLLAQILLLLELFLLLILYFRIHALAIRVLPLLSIQGVGPLLGFIE